MYLGKAATKQKTYTRPQAQRTTATLPQSHHVLEDILSNTSVRKMLLWITKRDSSGKCFFERLCENYDNPNSRNLDRLRWTIANWAINYGLKKARLDKATMKEKLFHHPPTVKALTLTAKSIGTYGLTVPQRYTAPLFVVWNITQACNLTCKHCYQDATRKPKTDELKTAEKLNLLDQMADEFVPFLALAGGEPLVTPDLWRVLEHCRKRSIHVTLATNGTLLTPEMCQRLTDANVKYIEVSIDSLDPARHDAFRGQAGAWKRAIQGIRNSVAAGIKTGMACCFTRENVHMVDEAVNFAIGLGCKTFAHFNFIPVGRGREIMDQDLTPGQRELLLRKLQRHLEAGKIGVVSTAPQFGRACIVYGDQDGVFATGHAGRGPGKRTMVLSRYIGGCGSGRCYCSVQPNGIITPCVYIPSEMVGDIRRQSLKEIWNNSLFDTLQDREDRGDHCGVCDYRHYCGGCRARALSYTGDIQAGDPGCTFNYHEWQELAADADLMAANMEREAWTGSSTMKHSETQQAVQLVQIIGSGLARSAAATGQAAGIKPEEIRDAENVTRRFGSVLSRPN